MMKKNIYPIVCFLILALVSVSNVLAKVNTVDDTDIKKKKVLMVGGGSSHDFDKYYRTQDLSLMNDISNVEAFYTDNIDSIPIYLKNTDLLILSNNQPFNKKAQKAIEKHISRGKPILLLHAALWYNWEDWPWYNKEIVGGGSRSHENFQEFKNVVINPSHAITKGVDHEFTFKDELYRHEVDKDIAGINVLVIGQSLETNSLFPVVFTINHQTSKIVGITQGHDHHSHDDPNYKKILTNALKWALKI